MTAFDSRLAAGSDLADRLTDHLGDDVVVLALPRGGVPVAAVVAERLGAPLDIVLVRKLGVPSQPELACGALGEGGVRVLLPHVVESCEVSADQIDETTERELGELQRRRDHYRGGRPMTEVADRTVIVVDDGIATGATMRAAISVLGAHRPRSIVVASPVAAAETVEQLSPLVDRVVVVHRPDDLRSVGSWYRDFHQIDDREVVATLGRLAQGDG